METYNQDYFYQINLINNSYESLLIGKKTVLAASGSVAKMVGLCPPNN